MAIALKLTANARMYGNNVKLLLLLDYMAIAVKLTVYARMYGNSSKVNYLC